MYEHHKSPHVALLDLLSLAQYLRKEVSTFFINKKQKCPEPLVIRFSNTITHVSNVIIGNWFVSTNLKKPDSLSDFSIVAVTAYEFNKKDDFYLDGIAIGAAMCSCCNVNHTDLVHHNSESVIKFLPLKINEGLHAQFQSPSTDSVYQIDLVLEKTSCESSNCQITWRIQEY